MRSSKDDIRHAVAMIEQAITILDGEGQDIAAIHLQEALEVIEHGHVLKPTLERIPRA